MSCAHRGNGSVGVGASFRKGSRTTCEYDEHGVVHVLLDCRGIREAWSCNGVIECRPSSHSNTAQDQLGAGVAHLCGSVLRKQLHDRLIIGDERTDSLQSTQDMLYFVGSAYNRGVYGDERTAQSCSGPEAQDPLGAAMNHDDQGIALADTAFSQIRGEALRGVFQLRIGPA